MTDPSELLIREATVDDDATCLEVIRSAFATVADDLGYRPETHSLHPAFWTPEQYARARRTDGPLLVAEVGGQLVGTCFVGPRPDDPKHWVIRRMAVVPEARHLGIGAALVRRAVDVARGADARVVTLRIVADNHQLGRWYLAQGFQLSHVGRPAGLPFRVADYELVLQPES